MTRARNGLALLAGAGLAWGLVERRWFALRHQTVPAIAPRDDAGMLRVLHLSDLHLQPGDRRMGDFVRRSLRRAPDLVVVTGDILGHPDAIDDAVAVLADAVSGRQGVAVLGSNDRYAPTVKNPFRYFAGPSGTPTSARMDTDRLVIGLKEAGWHVLCNERITLRTAIGDVVRGQRSGGVIERGPPRLLERDRIEGHRIEGAGRGDRPRVHQAQGLVGTGQGGGDPESP